MYRVIVGHLKQRIIIWTVAQLRFRFKGVTGCLTREIFLYFLPHKQSWLVYRVLHSTLRKSCVHDSRRKLKLPPSFPGYATEFLTYRLRMAGRRRLGMIIKPRDGFIKCVKTWWQRNRDDFTISDFSSSAACSIQDRSLYLATVMTCLVNPLLRQAESSFITYCWYQQLTDNKWQFRLPYFAADRPTGGRARLVRLLADRARINASCNSLLFMISAVISELNATDLSFEFINHSVILLSQHCVVNIGYFTWYVSDIIAQRSVLRNHFRGLLSLCFKKASYICVRPLSFKQLALQ
jgi:hypothetical protein